MTLASPALEQAAASVRPLVVSELARRGGAETSTVLIARSLQERGCAVRLAFARRGDMTRQAAADGVPLLLGCGTLWPGRARARMPWLIAAVHSRRFNLVHVSSIEQRTRWTALAALRAGIPTVAHLRVPWQLETAWELHEKGAFVITNSSATERALRQRGADRVRFVPNGYDPGPSPTPAQAAGVRAALGLPSDAVLALVVCNITPYKALDLLLPALVLALRAEPRLHVAHVGAAEFRSSQDYEQQWLEGVRASGVAGRIHLLGKRTDAAQLNASADFAIVPSRGEGTARVVLEAWAERRPVLAADVDGLNDLVVSGRNGVLVRLEDPEATAEAITGLADDPSTRTRLGTAGHDELRDLYSHHTHVDAILQVYAELLGLDRPTR